MSEFMKVVDSFVEFVGSNAEKAIHVVGKQTKHAAQVVSEKTSEFIDEQKIKSEIRSLKKGIEEDYSAIGRKVYENYGKEDVAEVSYDELCKDIETKEAQIVELRKRLDVE